MRTKLIISAVALVCLVFTSQAQQPDLQYFRPYDQRGINVFETSKDDTVVYDGFKIRWGANFKQQFQMLSHENATVATTPATPTQLMEIGSGFNLAMANLNLDVQLADGVRVSLISYMSTRHHPEFWVKGGFFQIDKVSFLNSAFMDKLWQDLTLRVGHMEINYGDAHFRRSDAGNGIYNPFIENNIMDAFTTEIGAELLWQRSGALVMIGMTDGEIQGNVTRPNDRKPAIYGKVGFDKQINASLRTRLTGSLYTSKSSIRNTLYGGDRAGSHYFMVMENTVATTAANFTSGRFNPLFTDNISSIMINPFVKFQGFELFGTYEIAKGNTATDNGELTTGTNGFVNRPDRQFNQLAMDALYRFANDKFYVGAKYNTIKGEAIFGQTAAAQGVRQDISIDRTAFAAGWFLTKNVLFKAEYVTQQYKDFPTGNIFEDGRFKGIMFEGIIGF